MKKLFGFLLVILGIGILNAQPALASDFDFDKGSSIMIIDDFGTDMFVVNTNLVTPGPDIGVVFTFKYDTKLATIDATDFDDDYGSYIFGTLEDEYRIPPLLSQAYNYNITTDLLFSKNILAYKNPPSLNEQKWIFRQVE